MTWRPPPTPPADTEYIVLTMLRTLLPPEVTVASDFVGWDEDALWVMVTRTGSTVEMAGRLDRVDIAVQVLAPGKAQAWDLASAVQVAFLSIPSVSTDVNAVRVNAGWSHVPMPDTLDGPSRYAASFEVHASGLVA